MRAVRRCVVGAAALFVALAPTGARGQALDSFDELRDAVKKGQKLVVTNESGRRFTGRVTETSPSSIKIVTDRDEAEVLRPGTLSASPRVDGLQNGIWGGALVGSIPAFSVASWCGSEGGHCFGGGAQDFAFVGWWTIPAGMGIGVLIDRAFKRQELYVEYQRTAKSSTSFTIAPWVDRRVRGLAAFVRF